MRIFMCCLRKKRTRKKAVKNYDHLTVFVKDGDYKCDYYTSYEGHNFGQTPVVNYTTGLKEGMLLKIRRISDYEASLAMIFPNGMVVSSKDLRLQKQEDSVTKYVVEADLMGSSRRPGMAFGYTPLPNGGIGVEASILFIYPYSVVATFGCVDLNAKPILHDDFSLPIPANSKSYSNYTIVANGVVEKLPISGVVGDSSEINEERMRSMVMYSFYMASENDIEKICANMDKCQELGALAALMGKGKSMTKDDAERANNIVTYLGLDKNSIIGSLEKTKKFLRQYKKQLVEKYSTNKTPI